LNWVVRGQIAPDKGEHTEGAGTEAPPDLDRPVSGCRKDASRSIVALESEVVLRETTPAPAVQRLGRAIFEISWIGLSKRLWFSQNS
jgi:hypothetical protein